MSATNNWVGTGYVHQEPRIFEKDGRPSVGSFSIGVNERLWDTEEGKMTNQKTWVNCVGFGPQASAVQAVIKPGRQVSVSGRLDLSEYEGTIRPRIHVDSIMVIDWGDDNSQNEAPYADADEDVSEEEFPF